MKVFMSACMSTHGETNLVQTMVQKLGFRQLLDSAASQFLSSAGGRACGAQTQEGNFVVASRADGVCTVFARRVDAAGLRKAVESWLPPERAGFSSTKREEPASGDLTTVSYQISRAGQPFAAWVVSTSAAEDAPYQGAVSVKSR